MIEHLVVVAGSSGCGKATLIKKLLTNKLPEINTRLGIDDFEEWHYVIGPDIFNLTEPPPKRVVLKYNSFELYRRKFANEQDQTEHFLQKVNEISFITIWTPPSRLVRQRFKRDLITIQESGVIVQGVRFEILFIILQLIPHRLTEWLLIRILQSKLKRRLSPRSKRFLKKYFKYYCQPYAFFGNPPKWFGDPAEVVKCYHYWFQFCDQYASTTRENIIVEFDNKLKFYFRNEWDEMVRIYT